jgi:pre-mRNA-splicing factor RBM22/SLT11
MEKQLNQEKEQGLIAPAEYDKADTAAMKLLTKLSKAEAYYKRDRPAPCREYAAGQCPRGDDCPYSHEPEDHPHLFFSISGEPVKRARLELDGGVTPSLVAKGDTIPVPLGPIDLTPPKDPKIMSLFVTGVEDDLPAYAIKEFFAPYGPIRSVVCVHKARSAFVNFTNRDAAEKAVREACGNGDIVIKSCPLRVQWSKPRALGPIAEDQARDIQQAKNKAQHVRAKHDKDERRRNPAMTSIAESAQKVNLMAAPPGAETAGRYRSQRGDYQE